MAESGKEKSNLAAFNNSWYKPGAPAIMRVFWYLANAWFMKSWIPGSFWRVFLLRTYGAKIGKGVVIKPGVNIKYPWRLEIGDHSWIGEKVWIDNLDQVRIGNHCCVSQGALLLCGNHNYKKVAFDLITGPIVLEDGAWVGAMCTVTANVTLFSHAVLSAGSIASKNLDAYSIYTGNPAVKVREREILP